MTREIPSLSPSTIRAIDKARAMEQAWDLMVAHALHGGTAYVAARDEFYRLNDGRPLRAALSSASLIGFSRDAHTLDPQS